MTKNVENIKKFTYGHQFECNKASLKTYIEMILRCSPSRANLESAIRKEFFSSHSSGTNAEITEDNQRKLAMNCFLSLRAYKLIDSNGRDDYQPSELSKKLASMPGEKEMYSEFGRHILLNLSGTDLLKAIESVNERGENPTLIEIIKQLNEMGYELSTNSIYPSTMRQWLDKAGLFESPIKIAWDVFYDLTGVDREFQEAIYKLDPGQKYFLLSILELNPAGFIPWPEVVSHLLTTKHLNYDMKMFPKTVLKPLIDAGFLEMDKTTVGRGAKPNTVRLTESGKSKFLVPFIANLANLVSIDGAELNRPFEDILVEVDSPDIHIKGKALELLAIWIIRMCSLRFTAWRKRDAETGKGEVDVMAASDTFVYSRWQIQCKNTTTVDIDVVAKEVGMSFLTKADVFLIITTGSFTRDAIQYADTLCTQSRYYVILIDGDHLKSIREDKTNIVPILNRIAKRTFVRREYGMTSSEANTIIDNLNEDNQASFLYNQFNASPDDS
jgi:hypothetical protein